MLRDSLSIQMIETRRRLPHPYSSGAMSRESGDGIIQSGATVRRFIAVRVAVRRVAATADADAAYTDAVLVASS